MTFVLRGSNRLFTIFQRGFTAKMSHSPPYISISPSSSLMDEKVEISVTGLGVKQHITLHASLVGDASETFESFAHYIADNHGKVVVSRDLSHGGSYSGIEPMGFLWSMKPAPGQKRGLRLAKKDVTKPYNIVLNCFDGHLNPEGGLQNSLKNGTLKPITNRTCKKSYMADGVKRIPVREGRVRGTLFIPPGEGLFPGVVDLFGTAGGLIEFRASLLASHGFATLALAFFGYDDLPNYLPHCDLEYFEEATEWLMKHSSVLSHGVGVIGVSKGSEISLMLAAHRSDIIRAAVAISPSIYISCVPFKTKGKLTGFFYDASKARRNEHGEFIFRDCSMPSQESDNVDPTAVIPVENISCPILLLVGLDDLTTATSEMATEIQKHLVSHGKGGLCSSESFPGTGHLIEPPHAPHCYASFHKLFKASFVWGGNAKQHCQAQEQSWKKILHFLSKNLGRNLTSHL